MDYSLSIQAALWLVCTACLNPYSNGLLSEFSIILQDGMRIGGLNPYSNGLLSELIQAWRLRLLHRCLNPYSNGLLSEKQVDGDNAVIILS